jgi:hypothetical protein
MPFHSGMNRDDYLTGKAIYDRQEALATPSGPKVEVSGPGFTMVLMGPFLVVMYPVVGVLAVAGAAAGGFAVGALWPSNQMAILFAAIVAGLATLNYGQTAEHALSRFKIYRVARHGLRLILLGGLVAQLLMTEFINTWSTTPVDAFNQATGGAIFAAIVAVVIMHFLLRRLDRAFFPVRDSYVISQERKYGGLADDEVFAIKNAKFRGMRAFALTWLAVSAVLIFTVPQAPVAVWAIGVFVVLWVFRGRLFFRLHRQRAAEAARTRASTGD